MNHRNLPRCMHQCAIALISLCGLFFIGCDKGTNTTSATAAAPEAKAAAGTGVLDLDAVAGAVLWKAEIDKDTETARSELSRRVTSFANEVDDKVKQHKADLIKAAKLNPQQIDDLNKNQNLDKLPLTKEQLNMLILVLQNQQQWVQAVNQKAGQLLQQRSQEIMQRYLNATRPIVLEVAKQRGLTVVLLKNDSIFYSDSSVNISDDVIADVRKNPVKVPYPAMPTMDLPTVNLVASPEIPTTNPTTQPGN